jgi:hypothetical protein
MTRTVLKGFNGSNPLGFMASVGLLRLLEVRGHHARLGFTEDGGFHARIECDPALGDIPGIVTKDAEAAAGPQPWRLEYEKQEKKGIKVVADLKAPPERFRGFLTSAIGEWLTGRPEQADYAAAYGTDVAVDDKGNTKPTAFHFTAANQQFLGAVEASRGKITRHWVEESLDDRDGKTKPGSNLRWDPDAERNRALMGVDPTDDGTAVNAPLEWLAFRGLPALPCVPAGSRVLTCGVTGRRQDELRFHWPLWSCGASYATVRSLLLLTAGWIQREEQIRRMIETHGGRGQRQRSSDRLQMDLENALEERRRRSVFAICTSEIRRIAQGYGNFGPAHVQT